MAQVISVPTGTVTFLFTDIEGSTRMWEQHARAMQAAVARHDALLREAIEQQGGYVFKTVGDAFCAAFTTAPQALDAALASQRALQRAEWDSTGPVRVRMALHTGAAEVRDNDYFGLPLNRVARLLSAGHGGQILLSLATQQLVRDHLPEGVTLKDLGEGGLKDLVRAEHVYQAVAPDLPSEFPPLKSLDVQYIEPSPDGSGIAAHNPYKGLRAFQEADAPDFFGREALTERLLGRMAEEGPLCRFLAVVGPSGSGKSSLVRAGLVPALRRGKGQLAGSDRWLIVEMLPGAHPLEELDAVLLSIAPNPPDTLMALFKEDERGLVRAAKRVLPRDESIELALVIDQFEEVFTLVEDEPARVRFLELLCAAVSDPRSRVRVVVTLRADFFDRPLLYPDPGELMRQRTAVVLPLSAEELERAIVEPSRRVGVTLEPELLAAIIKDVGEQPGSLPLLQYAMTELFERRKGKTMTLGAYQESGGVLGALSRRADEIYGSLSGEEQEGARQLFLRLVTLGEGVEDTRRRVRRSELESISGSGDKEALNRVVEAFGRYRLLTFDMDPVTKGPTVEVAHEALIRTWGRLQGWLEESRADLRVQRQLLTAAAEWNASGRDRSFLASGARLAQFEALAQGADETGGVALTAEEKEYLAASVEERDRQGKAEKERQQRELALQKRAASRLRYLVVGLAVFLVVAAILAIWALNQSQAADTNAKEANSQRQIAQSNAATAVANQGEADRERGLAVQSGATAQANYTRAEAQRLADEANALFTEGGSAETIALLSIRSMLTQYSPRGDAALTAASTLSYPSQMFVGHTAEVESVVFSPDGKYILTGSFDKTAKLWDARSGKEVRTFTGATDAIQSVAYSPDGRYVATGGYDSTARIWDAQSGKELQTLAHPNILRFVAFSPDSRYLLTGGRDTIVRLWDVESGKEVREFKGHGGPVLAGAFSPDGKYIVTGSRDATARIWDVQTGQELHRLTHESDLYSVAFSPDGKDVATGTLNGVVATWDAQTGTELQHFADHGGAQVFSVAYSPDGSTLLTGDIGSVVRLWDAHSGEELRHFTGFTAIVWSVAFSRDGRYIVCGSDDGTARLWDLGLTSELPSYPDDNGGGTTSLVVSPDGRYLLSPVTGGATKLWDVRTGQLVRTFAGHATLDNWAVFSPDGKYVLANAESDSAGLWDVQSGQEVRTFGGEGLGPQGLAFSPDGKQVLAGRVDGTAKLYDAQTGQAVRTFAAPDAVTLEGVAFSPDGKYVVTGSDDKTARLYDAQTGQLLHTLSGHGGKVMGVTFSPDGKYVLTGSDDETARLWDIQTGSPVMTYTGHTGAVGYVTFSPDGRYVLTQGGDSTARLWDRQSGVELRRYAGNAGGVAFTPDGKYVLSVQNDNTIRMWDLDYHDTINYLCGRLLRDFSSDERRQSDIKDNQPTCPR